MNFPFTKMHALGNDFVVLDFTQARFELTPEIAARIADRHFGVGCDQILVVEPSPAAGIDFGYRIYNADGSEVGQCGNGARCFALYVHRKGLSNKASISVQTLSGVMQLTLEPNTQQVQVNMGAPALAAEAIPLNLPNAARYHLELAYGPVEFSAVAMGNPHAVITVADVSRAPVVEVGQQLQAHAAFPQSVNVGFMQVHSRQHIALRVFERGVGETLACGSGACAAVVAGIQQGVLDHTVTVSLTGGNLQVFWPGVTPQGELPSVTMTGPATHVFDGVLEGLMVPAHEHQTNYAANAVL